MSSANNSQTSRNLRVLLIVSGVVVAWFALAEAGSQFWYASHESKLPKNRVPATGDEVLKQLRAFAEGRGSQVSEHEVGATAMEMLKCSYGKTLAWATPGEGTSALTILKWDERSAVGGVESMHNPGTCLRAAGWSVGKRSFLGTKKYCDTTAEVTRWDVSQGDVQMQAYSTVFRRYADANATEIPAGFANYSRLKSVYLGRRDAPLLLLLAYLPTGFGEADADARFDRIMRALFCQTAP